MHHYRQIRRQRIIRNQLKLSSTNCVRSVWRDASPHHRAFHVPEFRDFVLQFLEVLLGQSRIGPKRFLKHYPPQADRLQRAECQYAGIARVSYTSDTCARGLASTPCCRNVDIIWGHYFEAVRGHLSEPRIEVAFLLFEAAAHRGGFEMGIRINLA